MMVHDVAPCEMHVSSVGAVVPQAAKFETQGQPFLQPKMPKGNEKASNSPKLQHAPAKTNTMQCNGALSVPG